MKKSDLTKGIFIIATIALMAGGVVAVDAAINNNFLNENKNNSIQEQKGQMYNLSQEERNEMFAIRDERRATNRIDRESRRGNVMQALENNDYESWKNSIGQNNPFASQINSDNFSTLVEAHNLMRQGLVDEANEKFLEIGIDHSEFGRRGGNGMHYGNGANCPMLNN